MDILFPERLFICSLLSTSFLLFTTVFYVVRLEHSDDENVSSNPHFGRKTPYRLVENQDLREISIPGCYPIQIWALLRHGTRTPKQKFKKELSKVAEIRDAIRSHKENVSSEIDKSAIDDIIQWEPDYKMYDGSQLLTEEGKEEMMNLGFQYSSWFPKLLTQPYSNDKYIFRYTDTERTRDSARCFTAGLFGHQESKNVWYPEPLPIDPLLRFYKGCPKWNAQVKKNDDAKKEFILFRTGDVVNSVVRDVSKRLGFDYDLSFDDMYLMYTLCCYETAWKKGKISPWCEIFTEEELNVMEYHEDLKTYWVDGYGHSINHDIACILFNDAFRYLTENNNKPEGVFYFTHSGTMLKFLSHLKLYKDQEQLRHDNYEQMRNRLWRTSKIDSFGANIAFVSYKCGNEYKVLILHQGRPIALPECQQNADHLYPLSTMRDVYNKSINDCNVNHMCRHH